MPDNTLKIGVKPQVSFSYIILHDLGEIPISIHRIENIPANMRALFNGAYHVSSDELLQFGDSGTDICQILKSLHKERIRKRFLDVRKSIIFEIKTIILRTLVLKNGKSVQTNNRTPQLKIAVELTELGVFVFHVLLYPSVNMEVEDCIDFKNPNDVFAEVDIQLELGNHVRLHGNYSVLDIVRFYFICILCGILGKKRLSKKILSKFRRSESISEIEATLMSSISKSFKPFKEVEFFPIFSMNLEIDIPGMQHFITNSKKILRGLMTQDKNWDKKTEEIVSAIVPKSNFASRKTLAWFVHDMGSVKVYSSDFETPFLNSKLLTHFELGMILSMKYYLHRTIFRLQKALESNWTPRKLASFRRNEFDRLQNYYNLDIACKDTTATRFQEFIRIFHIDDALKNVEERFGYLGEAITTKYQQQLSRAQFLLTLVFGGFGAAKLGYTIFTRLLDPAVSLDTIKDEIALTSCGTLAVILFLIVIIGLMRKM
jgi:hypothetical protein